MLHSQRPCPLVSKEGLGLLLLSEYFLGKKGMVEFLDASKNSLQLLLVKYEVRSLRIKASQCRISSLTPNLLCFAKIGIFPLVILAVLLISCIGLCLSDLYLLRIPSCLSFQWFFFTKKKGFSCVGLCLCDLYLFRI